MKRTLSFLLTLSMILSFCAFSTPAIAADWALPAGTPMYQPGCVMETEFGSLMVIEAGFAKKAQSIIQRSSYGTSINGEPVTNFNDTVGYYTAKDGRALFAFKSILHNSSDADVLLETLHPSIRFGADEPTPMYGYPAVPFLAPERSTLAPGADVEIVFACTAPNELYFGSADILMDFAGGTLGFERELLGSYVSIGFTEKDGDPAGDIAELKALEESAIVAQQPHFDEIAVEDAALTYDSNRHEYKLNVKIRNNSGYPLIGKHSPIHVMVRFQFLDANGDVLPSEETAHGGHFAGYEDLAVGRSGWGQNYTYLSPAVVDDAQYIRFPSYQFGYGAINSDGSAQSVGGKITEPLVIDLDTILPDRHSTQTQSPSLTAENVTVKFLDRLPSSITGSAPYLAGNKSFDYTLSDSEVYAEIYFSLTNLTKKEIEINDLTDAPFVIELNFDDGFAYRTDDKRVCIYSAGKNVSAQSNTRRIGDAITIGPLVTKDITLYLMCSRLVETMVDKSLVVSFIPSYAIGQRVDVKVR